MAHAKRTHHNGNYSPEALARAQMRFERGDPVGEIADELGIERNSVYRIAKKRDWVRPAPAPRGLPTATLLMQEAEALAQSVLGQDAGESAPSCPRSSRASTPPPLPSPASGGGMGGGEDVDGRDKPGHDERCADCSPDEPPGPALGRPEDKLREIRDHYPSDPPAPHVASLMRATGASPSRDNDTSTLDRLERAVLAELATVEAARAQLGPLPKTSYQAQQTARTLATLTQTLQTLQRMRTASSHNAGSSHDDDMPADIDAFRYDLARRINAFVRSRTDRVRADGDAEPQAVDASR